MAITDNQLKKRDGRKMVVYSLRKSRLKDFLGKAMKSHEVIAPVKTDLVRFEKLLGPADISRIYLRQNSFFPVKEYFFRKREAIFSFDGNKITVAQDNPGKRIFFGLRRCDLNAIMHQDIAFTESFPDPYYQKMREGSILIGYHCTEPPSPYCFCGSLGLKDYFDLMFYDRGNEYFVEIGTPAGKSLVSIYRQYFRPSKKQITSQDRIIPGSDRLHKLDISGLYDHPDWQKGVNMCISCAACTNLCPTCYCFEVHDELDIHNPKKGERVRHWSSCQVKEFTKVAGGHVFREKRQERFKHRIYHQLEYFKEKHGISLCVGCGRCIEACPTRIDFVNIINEMR